MPYKDPDQARAFYREWKQSPKKKLSDKYYSAARNANRRAERWGVPGKLTTADIRDVLDGKVCTYCGSDDDHMCVDHVTPMAKGGPNTRDNLVPSCRTCNASKHLGGHPTQWSNEHECCVKCGSTHRKHTGKGLCARCHSTLSSARWRAAKRSD